MVDHLHHFFSSDGFMPHGHCYLWNPPLVWLHVISDGLTALAYTSIPFTLFSFARRRRDVPFGWMFLCFGSFIIACGATHFMEIWTLWVPSYWLAGAVKAVTAVASVSTAILLARLVPKALAIPTKQQLTPAHEELRRAHEELESRVRARTLELTEKNEELAREITERRQAEAAARDSEARKTAMMETVLDAIVLIDHEGQIIEWNASAERIFGYARHEVLGKSFGELLVPRSHGEAHRSGLERYLAAGEPHILGKHVELPALRRDGSEFPAEVAVARIRAEGPAVFTIYIRDITERRQAAEAEALRRAKEAAEEANAELESFSYSVAHDLRAPLRAINGFSTALAQDYGSKLDEQGNAMLDRVSAGAERMAELIDALLALARLSRTEPERETVDLTTLGHEIIERLRASDPGRSVEVVIADGLRVRGDRQLLAALLENLLGNAWKFTGGKANARIELGVESDQGVSVFYVRDNGAGFDMQHVGKLFAPFKRLHRSEQFEGTGIGLATVQRIVRRHGGRVWAQSAENEGATFRFTLAANSDLRDHNKTAPL